MDALTNGRGERNDWTNFLVDTFGLAKLLEADTRTLSGGEKQRLVLARALLARPEFLLLDEPTSALDFRWNPRVAAIIRAVAQSGMGILVVSHSRTLLDISDRLTFMFGGRVLERGAPREVLQNPSTDQLRSFLEARD